MNALIKYENGNSSKENANVHMHSARRNMKNDGIGRVEIFVNPNEMKRSKRNETKRHDQKTVERNALLDEKKDKEKQAPVEQQKSESTQTYPKTTPHQRARSKFPTKRILVKNTPVDLYQKYKCDWEKFRKYIPGENTREEVRKEVRTRLQTPPPPKPSVR